MNMRVALLALAVATATLFGAIPSHAETEVSGKSPGGAYFKIVVPDNWNGSLVIWNHGFSLSKRGPIEDYDELGPLQDLHLLQGYEVAASSYRLKGWAVFKTDADLRQLVAILTQEFQTPDQISL